MRMYTYAFDKYEDLTDFVNDHGITKEQIVDIFPNKGQYWLSYYAE